MLLAQLWLRAIYINYISRDPADYDTNLEFSTSEDIRNIYKDRGSIQPSLFMESKFSGSEVHEGSKL